MSKAKELLQAEIRYAIRLCERTARFYRKIQTWGTILSILGGSAVMASLAPSLPHWITISGGITLAVFGAILIGVRPAEKAVQNDNDVKRYQALMTKSHSLNADELQIALEEAHQGCAPEIDALRNVAYNDVVREIGRSESVIALSFFEKIFASIA